MINRILIRVKVLQNLYSYTLTKPDRTIDEALKELDKSFDESHRLYYYMLKLVVDLTDLQDRRLDDAKHKFNPTEQDLNPDTRFADNRLAQALRDNEEFIKCCHDHHVVWDNILFLNTMLNHVLQSEPYAAYMALEHTTMADDCELWRQLLKQVIVNDEAFADEIEAMSVYWSSEDIDVMCEFAVKTIRRIRDDVDDPLLPKFNSDDDSNFGQTLFTRTIELIDESRTLINGLLTDRWDEDRIALIDRLIMYTAIAEMRSFDSIPTTVTLNEYIELAKIFSTSKSGQFVNGLLNAAMIELRKSGKIVKP